MCLLAFAACNSTTGGRTRDGGSMLFPDGGSGATDLTARACDPSLPAACVGGNSVQTCAPDGSGLLVQDCPTGSTCAAGACTCVVGTSQCMGSDVGTCQPDGSYKLSHCPVGATCMGGVCDDARCPDELMSTNPEALPVKAWPRFRHDNRNSGTTPALVADMPVAGWKVFIGGTNLNGATGGLAGGPVVSQNNVVFIGGGDKDGMNGAFHAFDRAGTPIYTFNGMRGYGFTTPAVRTDGTAYFSSADGHGYAVDATGMQVWNFMFGFQNDCHPIVTKDGIVIYGSDNGSLYAFDGQGKMQWVSNVSSGPGEVDSALGESCDGRIYAGGKNGWTALDAKTGATLWKVPAGGAFNALMSSPTLTADGIMYGVDSAGVIVAIDPTGKVLWTNTSSSGGPGAGTALARAGNVIYGMLADGNLHALDAATGKEMWMRPVHNTPEMYVHPGPVIDGHHRVYINSNDGNVYAFDAQGTPLWTLPTGAPAAPAGGCCYANMAIGHDGTLYVPGVDGTLYTFK